MAQDQRGGAGGQQQTRRSFTITLSFRSSLIGDETYLIDRGGVAQTGWTISTNPSDITNARSVTFTITEPVGGATAGIYRMPVRNNRGLIITSYTFAWPPATVATATWTNTYFADNKLTSTLEFSHAVTNVATSDFEVRNDADALQTGWTFDAVTASIAANTPTQIAATAPNNVTADNYYIRLKEDSVRGPSATAGNSPAADLDTPNIAVGNTASMLTYSTRINFTYPSGIARIHANVTSDDNGFYFAQSGKMYAFDWDGTRDSARDVTFAGLLASQTIWGFTKNGNNWAVLTREAGTGTIGMVRVYNATGTNLLNFSIANSITTVPGEGLSGPKGLATDGTHYYIRVVRQVVDTHMRIVKYTMAGAATNENIVLSAAEPSRLSDLTHANGLLWIIQQTTRHAHAVRESDNTVVAALETDLNTNNTAPWATTAHNNSLYVAQRPPSANLDQAYIYQYSGIPEQRVVVLTAAWTNVNVSGGFLRGTITFSGGSVSGIAASDFEVINDDSPTPAVQSWTINTPQATATSQIISARIPTSSTGVNDMFALRLKATSVRGGTATDDNSPASAVTSSYIAIDTRPAVAATVTWGAASFTNGKLRSTITFSSSVTGIATSDFEVVNNASPPAPQSGWTFDAVTASGTSQAIAASPPAETFGTFALRIKASSTRSARATNDNSPATATASGTVDIDIRTASATWSNVAYDVSTNKLSGTITFNRAVTGIQAIDFHVLTGTNGATTGWSFDNPSATSAAANVGVTIRANAPVGRTNGNFKLELRARRVSGPNSSGNDSPSTDTRSAAVAVDNRPIEATASWSNVSYDPATNKLQGTITFSHSVTGIEDKDFVVVEGSTERAWTFDSLSASGTSAVVRATAPLRMTNGSFALRLAASSVHGPRATSDNSPENPVTSAAVMINNEPIVLTAAWSNERFANGRLQATLTFTGGAVRGIEASDFDIENEMGDVQMNWTISTPSATSTSQTISATPPDPTTGKFAIVLQMGSVLGPRATSTASPSPANNIESQFVEVDTSIAPTGGSGFFTNLLTIMAMDARMSRNMNRRDDERR